MHPPWARTISCTMLNPRPVPGTCPDSARRPICINTRPCPTAALTAQPAREYGSSRQSDNPTRRRQSLGKSGSILSGAGQYCRLPAEHLSQFAHALTGESAGKEHHASRITHHVLRFTHHASHQCTGVSQPWRSGTRPSVMSKNAVVSRAVIIPRWPSPTTMPSTEQIGVISTAVPQKKASSAR